MNALGSGRRPYDFHRIIIVIVLFIFVNKCSLLSDAFICFHVFLLSSA